MLCQFPPPVFFHHFPDPFHSLDHEHPGLSKIVFGSISILIQKRVVASPPDKRISVCVRFYLCPVNVEFFQRNESFLLQAAHKLAVQFIQNPARQFFPFKVIKSIPLGLLPFRQPDKGKIPLAQIYNAVNRPDSPHVCVSNHRIQHDWVIPSSSLI